MTAPSSDAAARDADRRRAAKILYAPVGVVSSVVGGIVAARAFRLLYKHLTPGPDDHGPKPLDSSARLREVLVGAVFQAAVFAAVKALVERGGARLFERWTGEWPGE